MAFEHMFVWKENLLSFIQNRNPKHEEAHHSVHHRADNFGNACLFPMSQSGSC